MSLTGEIRVKLSASQTKTYDVATPRFSPVVEKLISISSGTGANQADILYVDDFSIAASGSMTYDLSGSLTDALGQAITAVEVVAVLVTASDANVNSVNVGGATAAQTLIFNGTSGGISVKPGGAFLIVAPNAAGQSVVTATTADLIALANSSSGTAVTGTIAILARSV